MERGLLFSVIVPTHNRLDCLLEALDSIWLQSFTDYEVIVVDDGSTDGTQTVVLEMLKSGNAQKLKLGRPAADGELLIADGGGKTAALLMADVG